MNKLTQQKILDYIHWTHKKEYLKIMQDFVVEKLTGTQFEESFCNLYLNVEKEAELISNNIEKIKLLDLDSTINFREGLQDILLDLDIFVEDESFVKNKLSYYKTTIQLRQLVKEVITEVESYP